MLQELMTMIENMQGEDGAAEIASETAADAGTSSIYSINTGSGDDVVNLGSLAEAAQA
jgi:hypothetical protein